LPAQIRRLVSPENPPRPSDRADPGIEASPDALLIRFRSSSAPRRF